jgi:membrane protease YdiL (CAAX protease family)
MGTRVNRIFRDWQFYLCLGLGPLTWLLMSFLYPVRDSTGVPDLPWYQLFLVLLILPVLEEIVFRGLLLEVLAKRFRQRFAQLTLANLLTSLVFVALHLIHSASGWALLVFFPSLVFGYLKERHASLISPILTHIFYNLGFYWLFWR